MVAERQESGTASVQGECSTKPFYSALNVLENFIIVFLVHCDYSL